MLVVPKGVEHKPYAEQEEVKLLLIEPRGVPNTGDQGGDRTAENESGFDGFSPPIRIGRSHRRCKPR
jgi:hypothetical protein